MQGLLENKPVLYGLAGTGLVALLGAAQIIPSINDNLELVSLPVQVRPSVALFSNHYPCVSARCVWYALTR